MAGTNVHVLTYNLYRERQENIFSRFEKELWKLCCPNAKEVAVHLETAWFTRQDKKWAGTGRWGDGARTSPVTTMQLQTEVALHPGLAQDSHGVTSCPARQEPKWGKKKGWKVSQTLHQSTRPASSLQPFVEGGARRPRSWQKWHFLSSPKHSVLIWQAYAAVSSCGCWWSWHELRPGHGWIPGLRREENQAHHVWGDTAFGTAAIQ